MVESVRPFVHLHCHSHYSLLDGASAIDRLVERAKSHGMNGLALTDHGNLHGALQFYNSCKKNDINPIIGYEAYIAPGKRTDKSSGGRENNYHLTLLCQNKTGFHNLVKMASAASLEGFYFKPRIDKELLEKHNEGIICLSGCVSSEFNQAILRGGNGAEESIKQSMDVANWFQSIFGDRYFIEIMNNGVDIQRIALEGSVEVSQKLGIPLVATSDCHYVDREDAEAQDVMLCINTGKFRTDTHRMKMDGQEYFLRSPDQMYEKFPGLEHAVARSQEIADSVDISLELGQRHFPVFKLPEGSDPGEKLRELCVEGLKERYAGDEEMLPGGELSEVVQARLDRELGVINKFGFHNYFLIVWDFVREARDRGIPATARGSGVGALVCYSLYLSHVCPIRYDLLFERFLDDNRAEAPDIDIDFCKERRGEIITYVKETYGEDSVAQIGTFGTLAAKAAIKDVGRALGMPLGRVSEITGLVPDRPKVKIKDAMAESEELRQAYETDPEVREMIDFAKKLEGLARNVGTHAAAVVIGDKPLTEYLPLGRVAGKDDIITQWSMEDVEAAGLLKMDFLGLRNLTVLSNAVEVIEENTGTKLDLNRLPLDCKKTFGLLQRGETKGVFQLESGGIRDLLQKMKPDHFLDIIATNALYRPGPLEGGMVQQYIDVKHGRKEAKYDHEFLEEILGETHGVMVYQEQVMRILNRLGGIQLREAYTCIKAISKKKEEIIARNHEQFIEGSVGNGVNKNVAENLWQMILKFAGYGFNKSHSTAYALIAYQTAYLKSHYPLQFMAALLTGDIPHRNFLRKDSLIEHIEDCQRIGIEVVPPSVNYSNVNFDVSDDKIMFALSAIKGVGAAASAALVKERKENGPYKDIFEFCERVPASECPKSSIECLIKAGAMDCFGVFRSQLLASIESAIQAGASLQADRKSGQKNLFEEFTEDAAEEDNSVSMPAIEELPQRELLAFEKEVLGYYLTSHPLEQFRSKLTQFCSHTTRDSVRFEHRQKITMGGLISSIKFSNVRRARDPDSPTRYVMFDLEDFDGNIRCIQWPTEFAKQGEMVRPDAIVVIQGTVDRRGGDEANLVVDKIVPLEQLDQELTSGICINVRDTDDPDIFSKINEIVRGYPGTNDLELEIDLETGYRVRARCNKSKIEISDELLSRLRNLLGSGAYELLVKQTAQAAPTPHTNGRRVPVNS